MIIFYSKIINAFFIEETGWMHLFMGDFLRWKETKLKLKLPLLIAFPTLQSIYFIISCQASSNLDSVNVRVIVEGNGFSDPG